MLSNYKKKNKQNGQFIETGQILSDGVQKLKEGKKILYETEDIGIEIQKKLKEDGLKINKLRNRVKFYLLMKLC